MNGQPLTPAEQEEMRQLSERLFPEGRNAKQQPLTEEEMSQPHYGRYESLVIRYFNNNQYLN